MNIEQRAKDGATVLALSGRLDGNTSGALESQFLQLVEQGAARFVFDLSQLEYVSSAGLRSFLLAAKKIKTIQGKLALAHLNQNVKEVFDMSGFSAIFTICATERDALEAVG
ncbi:STAS domain-containing protein [Paenibacillus ginsengarvi]|uniref:Anti-sigma factor antagonist n=1 Tax=Paenibacillus ginsengarvi TaxID=400777 RepID=A0A3B0CKE9_9BACL|nr:STAS domain-containing protein [Paenibacillus ginsengarvi]RKN84807.1 anti-sigma factor antagonist [Paenibacillus ginsengarvi]